MARRLSLEETQKCLRAWRELGDEESLTLLTICNSGLVAYFAKKYSGKGLDFEELVSAGNEGLIRAINKFDYNIREVQGFSVYIATAIENSMIADLRKNNKHSNVLSIYEPLGHNKDGDELTIEDIVGTDAEELLENVIAEIKNNTVRDALRSLTSRQQQIIFLRYGLDEAHQKTQNEVAEMFGCSKTTIAKEEHKALVKMRHPRNTRRLKDYIDN